MVCNGSAACEGQLALLSQGALASAKKRGAVIYGKKKYKILPGKKPTIKIKLNRRGRALLRGKRHRAQVRLRITPRGSSPALTGLTLTD